MSYPGQATNFSSGTVYSSTWGNWVNKKSVASLNLADYLTATQLADGIACTASIDITAALQAAIDDAYTQVITQVVFDEYGWQSRGGATVEIPRGKFLIAGQVTIRPNVSLKGQGKSSSCLYSTYNGDVFVLAAPTKSGEYNPAGISIEDLFFLGDKTKTSQIAFNLLRPVGMKMRGVVINSCGLNGLKLREASNGLFEDIEIANCKSTGLIVTEGDTALPSNANTFVGVRILFNDGDGIALTGGVQGNRFIGGSVERNGHATGGIGYYNIRDESVCAVPNCFDDTWVEGTCEAHIYVNHASSGDVTRINNLKHWGAYGSDTPKRAVIVDSGTVFLNNPIGSSNAYQNIAGSTSPFRVKKATGVLYLSDASGSLVSGLGFVEDETGAHVGLYNNLRQRIPGATYGPQVFYNDNGAADGLELRTDTLTANPWVRFNSNAKSFAFGSGSAAVDAGIERKAANVLGMLSGDSFQVGGIAGETLKFNTGTANGSVATTLGSVGPTGATAGNPQGWLRINVNGTDRFVPYW